MEIIFKEEGVSFDGKKHSVVFATNKESASLLVKYSPEELCEDFNKYYRKLLSLIDFVSCDKDKKEKLEEDLDDTLDTFLSKETNKNNARKVLEKYVPRNKRSAFETYLSEV